MRHGRLNFESRNFAINPRKSYPLSSQQFADERLLIADTRCKSEQPQGFRLLASHR